MYNCPEARKVWACSAELHTSTTTDTLLLQNARAFMLLLQRSAPSNARRRRNGKSLRRKTAASTALSSLTLPMHTPPRLPACMSILLVSTRHRTPHEPTTQPQLLSSTHETPTTADRFNYTAPTTVTQVQWYTQALPHQAVVATPQPCHPATEPIMAKTAQLTAFSRADT